MTVQAFLPGFERDELEELRERYFAVKHIQDSAERKRLQPLYFAALMAAEVAEFGVRPWWHK